MHLPFPRSGRARTAALVAILWAIAGRAIALPVFEAISESTAVASARPRIGLALGGGGARGAAHLGVFRVLEELRIPIDYCAGTSMGAIMGALYASGMSPGEMNEAIGQVDWRLLFHDAPARSDISMRRKEEDQLPLFGFEMGLERHGVILPSGIIAGQKLQFLLRTLTLASTDIERFDELPIPFRAVACDLATGEMVVLDHGDLSDAMRASMAIPGAFTPEKAEGRILVDGGIVQNLPVETVREMGADVVIAVDVGSALPKIEESGPSFVGVATRALDLLTRANSRVSRSTLGPGDLLIAPDLPEIDTSSFDHMLIAARHGEEAARNRIDDLRRYSVSEEEYSAWQGRVRGWAEARAGTFRVESIEVTGTRRVSPELIKRRIRTRAGSDLDMEVLRGDLDRIARIGEFERIDFSIDGGEGARRLVIQAREKSWGPGYLRIGLGIEGDFDADADIVATLHYRRAFANRLGGEWRAVLGGGDRLTLDSDFYQPLVESGALFISPSVRLLYDKDRFFLEEDQPVVGKILWYNGQLDVGIQVENAVELRAGILRGRFEGETDVALSPLDSRAQIGAFVARLLYDRLDEYPLPRCGSWLQTDLTLSSAGLGGDGEYDRLLVRVANARSLGKNTVFFRSIFGTDFGTRLPLYDRHTLGGFLRLSGLEPDALVGDVVTFASLVYYREIDRLAPFLGRGIVLGCAIEGGEVWDRIGEFRLRDLRPAGLLLLGGRTVLGPVYFGYGATEGGQTAGYFYIGKPFP